MFIIKQLRRKKGLSQSEFAKEIGVSLRTIQLYERKGANIPMKNLTKIANFFDMSIDEMYFREFNDPQASYAHKKPFAKHGSAFYPLDHGKYLIMSHLVHMEQQKEYIGMVKAQIEAKNAYQTGFVLDALDDGRHMAFEITGDSMNDGSIASVPNKAIVLGVLVDTKDITTPNSSYLGKPYILVCSDRIICKQIMDYNSETHSIHCSNLNKSPEYQDFELPLKDILQIFQIAKKQL
nr:helix-turn-helix transcriptional regulator [Allomuricauda sp.]